MERNCASRCSFAKNHYMMHGQQNIKKNLKTLLLHFAVVTFRCCYISLLLHFAVVTFRCCYISLLLHFTVVTCHCCYISLSIAFSAPLICQVIQYFCSNRPTEQFQTATNGHSPKCRPKFTICFRNTSQDCPIIFGFVANPPTASVV